MQTAAAAEPTRPGHADCPAQSCLTRCAVLSSPVWDLLVHFWITDHPGETPRLMAFVTRRRSKCHQTTGGNEKAHGGLATRHGPRQPQSREGHRPADADPLGTLSPNPAAVPLGTSGPPRVSGHRIQVSSLSFPTLFNRRRISDSHEPRAEESWVGRAGAQPEAAERGGSRRPLGGPLPRGSRHAPRTPPGDSDRADQAVLPRGPASEPLTSVPSSAAPFPDLRAHHPLPEALPPGGARSTAELPTEHQPRQAVPAAPHPLPGWMKDGQGRHPGSSSSSSSGTSSSASSRRVRTRPALSPRGAAARPLPPGGWAGPHLPPPRPTPPLSRLAGLAPLAPFPGPFLVSQPLLDGVGVASPGRAGGRVRCSGGRGSSVMPGWPRPLSRPPGPPGRAALGRICPVTTGHCMGGVWPVSSARRCAWPRQAIRGHWGAMTPAQREDGRAPCA